MQPSDVTDWNAEFRIDSNLDMDCNDMENDSEEPFSFELYKNQFVAQGKFKKTLTTMGLEPTIFRFEVGRHIH